MSETIKFTQEELDQVSALRDETSQTIAEFGQVEIEIILANQRLDSLNKAKDKMREDYIGLQNKERDLVQKLNEKYGAGQVDLNSGEFIPVK